MIYDLKGYKIDISDSLLKEFKEEMGTISQEMIDTCAKLALVTYDDIGTGKDLKRRVEDIMFIEMTKHRDAREEPADVIPGKIYNIEGYNIIATGAMTSLFEDTMGYPLDERELYIYTAVALERHEGEQFTSSQLSGYVYDELKAETGMYD